VKTTSTTTATATAATTTTTKVNELKMLEYVESHAKQTPFLSQSSKVFFSFPFKLKN
jgi:hypothetical protein